MAEAIAAVYSFTKTANLSQAAISSLFNMLHSQLLPRSNAMPANAAAAAQLISPYNVTCQNLPACQYDCVVFTDELAGEDACPVCKQPSVRDDGKAHKLFRTAPLIPSFQRLFLDPGRSAQSAAVQRSTW